MIDYHVHTRLCNHASGTMEDYVEQAISAGLDEICFTDHVTPCSPGRDNAMDIREIPLYLQAVHRIKQMFSDKIVVKSGLEIDFDEEWVSLYKDIVHGYDFDAVICSVHFASGLNIASRKSASALEESNQAMICNQYFDKLETMLDYDFFDIVGHLDIIKKTGIVEMSNYQDRLGSMLTKIAENGLTLEFNASGFAYPCRDSFPSLSLADQCKKANVGVTIGSDAHKSSQVGRFSDDIIEELWRAGYRHIHAFTGRQVVPKKLIRKNETR